MRLIDFDICTNADYLCGNRVTLNLEDVNEEQLKILVEYCDRDDSYRDLYTPYSGDILRHSKRAKASKYVSYDRKEREKLVPKKVIFNPPATIVFWKDGTKTIVKCREDDIFDEEIGLSMAIAQKFAGDRSKFKKIVKKASRPQEKHTL